ncbi:MAG: ATP-binding cassette domain-containing protein [Actinobacteria bacterium]|nr:ATP-binding cassette domain-containing protein [Actinomycetota bacterium]
MNNRLKPEKITIEGLTYQYKNTGEQVLKGVDAEFHAGRYYVILGRNGSGKSTLLRCINSLLEPTEGKVTVCGIDSSRPENSCEILKNVSTIFQDPQSQIVGATVEDDVAFGPENLGLEINLIEKRVNDAVEMTGIAKISLEQPQKLSMGQKQLVSITGALAMEPLFLLSDESTSMLDDGARGTVLELFMKLRDRGTGVIHVTHFLEEAIDADEVLVLDRGRIGLRGKPEDVISNPDRMLENGLEPLPVTMVASELESLGTRPGPGGILTVKELMAWLKS